MRSEYPCRRIRIETTRELMVYAGEITQETGAECMSQHSLSFCETETLYMSLVKHRGKTFRHDVCEVLASKDITQGK